MLKKALINLLLLIFIVTSVSYKGANQPDKFDKINAIESDGLYEPETLKLYNNAVNDQNIYLNDFYAPIYFTNLRTNFGNNTKGSCGYVATGMLLSFWDTYWDDSIINENYDKNEVLNGPNFDFSVDSPGIEMEPSSVADVSDEIYHSNIFKYSSIYFQFLLITMGDSLYGTHAGSYGMGYSDYSKLFNYYVYKYKGYTTSDVEVIEESCDVRNKTINLIKQGIPVKLGIGTHAVIAYDYDEKSDRIYCHFGWGPNTTHVTIEEMGYKSYDNLFAFNFKNKHSHSNNYKFIDKNNSMGIETFCPSMLVVPSKIEIDGKYGIDEAPMFRWNSFIKEKWFKNIELYHELSVLDENRNVIYKKSKIFDNKYKLSFDELHEILNLKLDFYYIYIGLASDVDPYWDDYYCCFAFSKPNEYINKSKFSPQDWKFNGRYYFANELSDSQISKDPSRMTTIVSNNGLTVTTNRLRCGYIENSYIVLSPRRENAGKAYFEMNFDKCVYSFMYQACLWSSSENIDGEAIILIKDRYGNWNKLKYIPISQLKSKAYDISSFVEQTPQGIYGIRFEVNSTPTGTWNKGRFCINDIVLSTKRGSENNIY